MHDHWSLFKSYPFFERTFSFSGKYTEKKGGDHGVHQGRYII